MKKDNENNARTTRNFVFTDWFLYPVVNNRARKCYNTRSQY